MNRFARPIIMSSPSFSPRQPTEMMISMRTLSFISSARDDEQIFWERAVPPTQKLRDAREQASVPRRISHLTEIRSPPAHSNSGNGDKLILQDLHHQERFKARHRNLIINLKHLVFEWKRFIDLNVQVFMIRKAENLKEKMLSKT